MAKFWDIVQPTVWSPTSCDCWGYDYEPGIPDYGPHISWVPDREGHEPHEDLVAPRLKWPILICECGWRDLDFNYPEHLAKASKRKVAVYS